MSRPAALVMGIEGHSISPEERAVYSNRQPAGFILFRRNVDNPAQLRALTDSLRDLTGNDDLPILIDQEGGPFSICPGGNTIVRANLHGICTPSNSAKGRGGGAQKIRMHIITTLVRG